MLFHDGRVGVFEGDSFEGRGVQVGVDALFEEVVGEGTGVVEDVECLSFGDFVQDEEVFRDDFEVQGKRFSSGMTVRSWDASVSSQM